MKVNAKWGWPCMFHWIVNAFIGKIVLLFDKVNSQTKMGTNHWFWRQYLIKGYGYIYIWRFKLVGSNNKINVLNRSPLIQDLLKGANVNINFKMNDNVHPHYYLLVNGICPWWPCFVFIIHEPKEKKCQHLSKLQEASHKDVKHYLNVL